MKTRLTTPQFLIVLCSTFATTTVFGQATFTWIAAGDRTSLTDANNWNPNGLPNGATQDTAQWDGVTTTNLVINYGSTSLPGTGFGTSGINFVLTRSQTNSVTIIAPVSSQNVGFFGLINDSDSAALILGDGTANRLNFVGRPAGGVHTWVNNSTTPVTINPSVRWQAGGGNGYTMDFGGPGDWAINNYLRDDNNAGPKTITVTGPGATIWTAAGLVGNSAIGSVNINGGTLVLKSSGLLANQPIVNDATLQYDAAAQAQTLGGAISGSGLLKVSNGTLTLGGPNLYTGNTEIHNNGTLIVGSAENAGVFGPLGVGGAISFLGGTLQWSVNNTFDYSDRFSTDTGQLYKFDTAGQNATLATGLISIGGTLTKVGSGTLTLAGDNTYDGATTVSAGKLLLQGLKVGAGAITVADGATLGVADTGLPVTPGTLTLGTSSGAVLEFENVISKTTAPLAAGTLSSAGTVTININSGTFAGGQSYPLFSWINGPAPAVSIGTVNGAVGTLSTNGNTIQLNIIAVALTWSGANNGNWDTTTPNNWLHAGSPTTYSDLAPTLFDDTAAGTSSVTVNEVVQPATVTVNNNTKAYNVTTSSGKNISGSARLIKSGSGSLTLAGGANAHSGGTTVSGGRLSVGTLAPGGAASDIGASSSSAGNLVLNGGTLQYTGGGASSDRLFTLGTGGGTMDASGSGALDLNNPGAVGLSGPGARVLTLTGTSAADNTLAAALGNNGGVTSLTKSGDGKWILTANNTYSGATTIAGGTLQVGTGGPSGSLGGGNITDNGALIFNRSGAVTNGVVSGSGSLTLDGTGTVVLPGNNTYSGGTTINAGTLQIGTGGATGQLNGNSAIVNNGTLVFNSTGPFALGAGSTISGTGSLVKRGSGLLKLISANTYTGGTIIDPGAQLQVAEGNQGSIVGDIANNGTLIFVRQDNGAFIITGTISGTGLMVKDVNNPNAGDVTLTGNNTYSGGTIIRGGAVILGDGFTPDTGSIVGNVLMTNSAVADTPRLLTFNRPDDLTFGGAISGSGAVLHNGAGTLTLTGANTYTAGTTINGGMLQVGAGGPSGSLGTGNIADNTLLVFNRSDELTVSGVISGVGSVVQQGSGTLTLTAANTYTGTTTVSNGTLIVHNNNSAALTIVYGGTLGGTGTFFGPVTLDADTTLAPGPAVGTLTINGDLNIGGNLTIEVNKSLSPPNDFVVVGAALANTGLGTLTVANLGPALALGDKFTLFSKPVLNGETLTINGAGATWSNNLNADGSITVSALVGAPTLNFTRAGNSLQFSWTGGMKLQAQTNSLNVGLSNNWADYPGGNSSPISVPIDVTKPTVFFRLVSTP